MYWLVVTLHVALSTSSCLPASPTASRFSMYCNCAACIPSVPPRISYHRICLKVSYLFQFRALINFVTFLSVNFVSIASFASILYPLPLSRQFCIHCHSRVNFMSIATSRANFLNLLYIFCFPYCYYLYYIIVCKFLVVRNIRSTIINRHLIFGIQ